MSNKISRRGFLGLVAAGAVASVGVLAACGKTNSTNEAANTSEAAGDTQRVVALNTGQLDNLLMLGIVPVGVAAAKGAELIPQFIKDKFGSQYDLDSIANCGLRQTPNVEAISKLEPTLICANERTDEEILTKLRDIAPVVTGKGGGENWKDDLATIAEAVGKKDEAKKLLDAYLADAADFKGKLPAEVPTVSFLRTKDDAFQV
ncbi:MAG: ABC transporter substrate-binding protein, partial [Corynebacterium matruchotii]